MAGEIATKTNMATAWLRQAQPPPISFPLASYRPGSSGSEGLKLQSKRLRSSYVRVDESVDLNRRTEVSSWLRSTNPSMLYVPSPLVLMLHGFTGWKEEEHLATLARALADVGIASVRWDAPGSGESEGTFEDDYRLSSYVASVDSVIDWAGGGFGNIGIWGHSMGGFVALHSAVAHPETFKGVCGSQPSQGKPRFADDVVEQWRMTGFKQFSNQRFPDINLAVCVLRRPTTVRPLERNRRR